MSERQHKRVLTHEIGQGCTIGPLRSVSAQRALARAQLNLTSFHGTGDAVPNPAPVGGRGVLYEWWDDLKGDALWHQNKKGNLEKFIASGRPIVEGNPMFESGNATYGWQVLTDEFAAPRMVGCAGNKFSGVGKSMEYCTSHFANNKCPTRLVSESTHPIARHK